MNLLKEQTAALFFRYSNSCRWHGPPLCAVWPGCTFTGSFWSIECFLHCSFNSGQLLVRFEVSSVVSIHTGISVTIALITAFIQREPLLLGLTDVHRMLEHLWLPWWLNVQHTSCIHALVPVQDRGYVNCFSVCMHIFHVTSSNKTHLCLIQYFCFKSH